MTPDPVRVEHDPLGEHTVPSDAYYGIQTSRAVENFPISGLHAPADLVTAAYAISGVFDLLPLQHCSQNQDLRLDEAEASALREALEPSRTSIPAFRWRR